MASYIEYKLVYINSDGSIVNILQAEWEAQPFIDFGDYLLPLEWY